MKALNILVCLVGILLLILAVIYFITPAASLPSFLPGYDPTLSTPHHKHAIASVLLALAAFAFVWFNSKKKSPQGQNQTAQ